MKQMVGRLVPVVVLLGGLFWLAERFTPTIAPEDVVDLFVDAGIEFTASPTEASLLEQRKIVIGTDINGSMTQRVVRALLLLDSQDSGRPIDLYIRTEGGRIDDAFAIIDVMKGLKSPVNTHAIGGTHSSGAMILAAGTGVRYAYPFSSIMFHGGLYDQDGDYGQNTTDNQRLVAFWKQHANLPADWMECQGEKACFMGPDEALKFGIVDQIRPGRPALEGRAPAREN
ncbi:MAG TPA: ATP-dependent Clp protease proteolytic subunit [Sedimentisphaerales bacterium]|nr:ATP-dependent Clp protease proteolytic subunit [Sedimentisphaerales bacterium]